MANVTKIAGYDIKDTISRKGTTHYIVGNPTNASVHPSVACKTSSPRYSSRWRGDCDNIDDLYSGLRVTYKIPVAGNASYFVLLDINDLGEHPVVYNVNTSVGTRYGVGSIVDLVYDADQDASAYLGTSSTQNVLVTGCWKICDYDANSNTVPTAYCTTGATTVAKVASCTNYALSANSYLHVLFQYTNTANTPTLNVNSKGAKAIWINGEPSSATNKDIPAGTYLVFYDGTRYHLRTDGALPLCPANVTSSANTNSANSITGEIIDSLETTDSLVVLDKSTHKVRPSNIQFNTNGSGFLREDGTWQAISIDNAMVFIGTTTTPLVDDSSTNPITIDGSTVTAENGNVVLQDSSRREFLWDGSTGKWKLLGEGEFGTLAYKNAVNVNVPSQSVKLKMNASGSLSGNTGSTAPTITGTISIGTGTGTANYTPGGSVTYTHTDASNLLTSTVAPEANGTQVLTSARVAQDSVVVSGTKKYFHPSLSGGSVTLSSSSNGDVTFATGEIDASNDVSPYNHSHGFTQPTISLTSNTTSTGGLNYVSAVYVSYTEDGAVDDCSLCFTSLGADPDNATDTLYNVTLGVGRVTIVSGVNVTNNKYIHASASGGAVNTSSDKVSAIESLKTDKMKASLTNPTVSLGSNTTASGGVQYIEDVNKNSSAISASGDSKYAVTFASQPTLSRDVALKTITPSFSGTAVELTATPSLSTSAHTHPLSGTGVDAAVSVSGTISNNGTTETFSTGAAGAATVTYTPN